LKWQLDLVKTGGLDDRFEVVTATSYADCKSKLADRKPDIWVLDLYSHRSGGASTAQQLTDMAERYADLQQRERDFQGFLAQIGQTSDEGILRLRVCRSDYNVPVVMFTRKGSLEDAQRCRDEGAADVLKKPMPADLQGSHEEKHELQDRAMLASAAYLKERLIRVIESNSFWNRWRAEIYLAVGFILGVANNIVAAPLIKFLGF
jgi:CheY-like chemotaxis protein